MTGADGTPRDVWVVVLNYQGADDTRECVASLLRHAPWARVLVVDNGSTDGLAAELAQRSDLELLVLRENLGYTGGNNAGIRLALERGAAVVCVLNNDTVAHHDFLRPLVDRVAGSAVAASPVIEYADGGGTWFAGGVLDTTAGDVWPRHGQPDELEPFVHGVRATELLTGCCIAAATATWRAVGLFDDRFFLNFEDSEWSVRARGAGVALEVLEASTLEHKVSRSFVGAASALGTYYYLRNALLFQQVVSDRPLRARMRWLVLRAARPALGRVARGRHDQLGGAMLVLAVRDHLRGRYGRASAGTTLRAGRKRPDVRL